MFAHVAIDNLDAPCLNPLFRSLHLVEIAMKPKFGPAVAMTVMLGFVTFFIYDCTTYSRNEDPRTMISPTRDGVFLRTVVPYRTHPMDLNEISDTQHMLPVSGSADTTYFVLFHGPTGMYAVVSLYRDTPWAIPLKQHMELMERSGWGVTKQPVLDTREPQMVYATLRYCVVYKGPAACEPKRGKIAVRGVAENLIIEVAAEAPYEKWETAEPVFDSIFHSVSAGFRETSR